jgi:hypothetical protein
MKAILLLSTIAVSLIGATQSVADTFAPRLVRVSVICRRSVPSARVWLDR